MKITLCIDKQSRENPSSELRQYSIDIGCPLRSYEGVFDELKISTNDTNNLIGVIIRRCYVDKYGVLKKLETEETQELEISEITLFEGVNYVYIQEFTNLNMKIEYLTNAEMNKYYATKAEMNSSIKQTYDSIILQVSKEYVGSDKIVASINMSPESIKIDGKKITLANFDITDNKLTSVIKPEYDYTEEDIQKIQDYYLGKIELTDEEIKRLDINKDGIVDFFDAVMMLPMVGSGISNTNPGKFEIDTAPNSANIINFYDGEGALKYYVGYWESKLKILKVESLKINDLDLIKTQSINTIDFVYDENSNPNYIEVKNTNNEPYGITIWASDKRLKNNIQDTEYNALEKIKQIKHRQFDYKKGTHINLGYVADELEEIDENLIFEVGEEKIKQPAIDKIIPLLSKAIQEQQKQIETLENKIKELEGDK